MFVQRIRRQGTGERLSHHDLVALCVSLDRALMERGFVSSATVRNGTCLHISYHRKSFVVDTARVGYNWIRATHTKSGWKRTAIPTWEQRIRYNQTVNDVLDQWSIQSEVKSGTKRTPGGVFLIRTVIGGAKSPASWGRDPCTGPLTEAHMIMKRDVVDRAALRAVKGGVA